MILLTDYEIRAIGPEREPDYVAGVYYYYNDGIRDGAKAQLKKVVDWGEGECTHISVMRHRDESRHRRHECDVCRQTLKKEVGGKNA